jgi:outer membrane protein, multidrug efflux system
MRPIKLAFPTMFPKSTALAAAALLALGGCATQTPAVPENAGVPMPGVWSQSAPSGTASLAGWWRGFGDAQLVQLVEDSQRANTSVRAAEANLRQARALRDAAAAGLWPHVSASVSAQRSRAANTDSSNLFQAGFDASWEPDLFGANRHGAGVTQAQARASEATLASTHVSVAAEVAVSYLQLRGTQARAAFARQSLAAQEQTLQIVQWREQAGLGSSLETSQARSAVEQTRAQLPLLQSSIEQTAHALAVLTGRPPAALLETLSVPAALPQAAQGLALAIPAQALRQRPDVVAAEMQLRAAAERVAQADADRYPTVDLRASLAWSALTFGSLGGIGAARSLLAGISQTVFDHGQLSAQLAAQRAAFDAAQESYRASVLAALQDVEDSLSALAASRERVAALRNAVDASRDAQLLANNRYSSGLVDFQTVLDTQRTLLNVQDNMAGAEIDLATNHVRLYKALGGGWSAADPPKEGS